MREGALAISQSCVFAIEQKMYRLQPDAIKMTMSEMSLNLLRILESFADEDHVIENTAPATKCVLGCTHTR